MFNGKIESRTMATKLNKTRKTRKGGLTMSNVTRELASTDSKGNPLIITLEAGDYISFRPKGHRTVFTVHAKTVYYMGMANFLIERHQKKMEEYNRKKKAKLKIKKPKSFRIPTDPVTLQILAMKK